MSPLIAEASNRESEAAHDISLHLTSDEQAAIIAFLHTLTDADFVRAEAHSDPFARK